MDISSTQYSRQANANNFRLNTSLTSEGLSVTYSFLSLSLEAAVFKSNILKVNKKVFFLNKKVLSLSSTTLSNKTKFLLLSLKTVTTESVIQLQNLKRRLQQWRIIRNFFWLCQLFCFMFANVVIRLEVHQC